MSKLKFGNRLLNLRKDKGVSQSNVAKFLGLTVSAYQNYENGRREAGYETIAKLADFYSVTTDYLLGRPEAKPPENPISAFAKRMNLKELEKILITEYLKLSDQQRESVIKFMEKVIKNEEIRKSKI